MYASPGTPCDVDLGPARAFRIRDAVREGWDEHVVGLTGAGVVERPDAHRRQPVAEERLQGEQVGGRLARAVRRDRSDRGLFRQREVLGADGAVLVGAAHDEHALHTGVGARPQHAQRAAGVHLEHGLGRIPRLADVAQGRQVVDDVRPRRAEQRTHLSAVGHVDGPRAGAIEGDDIVTEAPQVGDQVPPDEPAAAGDRGSHASVR